MDKNKEVVLYDSDGEIITEPEKDTALDMSMASVKHLEEVAQNIDRYVEAQNKIRKAIYKLAKPGDWVIFEKETDGQVESMACLGGAGTERIASSLGISFENWTEKKDTGKDTIGENYTWWYECDCRFGSRIIRVMGHAGSRDKFFGRAHGDWKPLSEIDESNIRMAARRNCMKEGVKVMLGLRSIPLQELKDMGVPIVYGRRVTFKKQEKPIEKPKEEKPVENKIKDVETEKYKMPKDLQGMRNQIAEILLEVANGEKEDAIKLLEQVSSWTKDDGTVVEGKKSTYDLSDKQLHTVRNKALKLLENKEAK